uniref:Uncharacterized protein n=1 Tax=Neobodo designis TaxID=312471 RepID=A0A7S1L875_NEODS|mmetsp:Transcript_15528/g.48043  ORF Transcript_15528/g.48043 Transcript_15528/m.48043 type:complete len:160 (+) Transcript_15528:32-511(+)
MLKRTHLLGWRRFLDKHKSRRKRPNDNNPDMNQGPVEWLPRPVRFTWAHVDELQQWSMRKQLDADYDELNKFRDFHREWSQHPTRPVLGDYEPKMPRKIYKDNHVARVRFLYRWHRANSPKHWLWLPRTGSAPERRAHASDYPENWKVLRDADLQRSSR